MESTDFDGPDSKRPHLNPVSSPMARHTFDSSDNGPVDAGELQYQNQKLVQQLEVQKQALIELGNKVQDVKEKQTFYDNKLIELNQIWDELTDDLVLLGLWVGVHESALQTLDRVDHSRGSIPSCPAENIFLCKLLEVDSIENNDSDESLLYIKELLDNRISSTLALMKFLEDVICKQRAEMESISDALEGGSSLEDTMVHVTNLDLSVREEASFESKTIDALRLKHRFYADKIQAYIDNQPMDQSEISHLSGEVEETILELEESRRKLVNLKMQNDAVAGVLHPVQTSVNGSLSPEKSVDRSTGMQELKGSIEEIKIVVSDRSSELQDAQEYNVVLSKQLQELEDVLKDDKYIFSSRLYTLMSDQLQHWNAQAQRYRALTDSLQVEKSSIERREKELEVKAELLDASKDAFTNTEYKIKELEANLQNCIFDKNELEIKIEEAVQDSGRKDVKSEFQVMASALSKETGMMEAQLNRWKKTAHESLSLREQLQSLSTILREKTNEEMSLVENCNKQTTEIKSLRTLIERMEKEKLELQVILEMIGQQIYDNRDITEIRESERKACLQAELLRSTLEEHGLHLRVKAANETETACEHRLSAAEAEIADLRAKLDASDRDILELRETLKIKDGEAESYISEIETIGQAFEDMQTQNNRLLQQVTERDDYNIKLVSESVKTKQAQNLLLSEKQVLAKQLQHLNATLEPLKMRISDCEEQMKGCFMEAIKSTEEDRHLSVSVESTKLELADAEKELKLLKSAYSSSEKESELIQRKTDEIQMMLETERDERKKADEECTELKRQVCEMTLESGEAYIKKLQDEIKDCKAILKCGVCFDRPKEVVILKCFHLFCNPCIQRNLEIRHRKCPGCGTAFGQNDVKFVKI
ncbi:E3 ubiquitin-protein ligase BRE1-like 2 [Impatiens glandulifera]|uniref:E3 ubiquitin-protein ligase BRE1-like 2 n=1 Tax=Impatiens glandulifera TaxID=253017 RepID=UPI001FB0D370|nr:E3 ubiquitin-protein ligase BRE1-like 2 [Impatiens glandulifera]